jgi:tetratricopeptide (TPR) repeat protein
VAASSLLLVCTHRPEIEVGFPGAVRLRLTALAERDAEELVRHVAGERELPEPVCRRIVERADGVPLFLEELTKSVLESEAGGATAVPATLRDSLMARLDRLGAARHVAALASVLGRRFARELLAAVSDLPEQRLAQGLERLVDAELLFAAGEASNPTYTFKHALIQDVAYQSLLRNDRRAAHARVAEALETRFARRAALQPGLVAQHWDRADRPREAIRRYRDAGVRALERSAHAEAIAHLERGISLVDRVDEAERAGLEIGLHATLGMVLVTSQGYGNEAVARHQARARELSRSVGEGPDLYDALAGLYLYHSARADFKLASELAAQLLALGERRGDEFLSAWAHQFSGMSRFYEGRFGPALEHFEYAIALDEAGIEVPAWSTHEHDLAVAPRSFGAMTLAILGRVDSARDLIDRAITHGRRSDHPLNLAFALGFSTLVYQVRGEPQRVLENADAAIEVSSEQGFPVYLGMGCMMRGWAQAQALGADREAVLGQMHRGMAHTSTTGTRTEGARALGLLAEAQRALGCDEDAQKTVQGALSFSGAKESPYWDSALLRLDGEIRLEREPAARDDALERLRCARSLARDQGAGSLELKAAVSLARGLSLVGRSGEARELLEASLAGLCEGADTPDPRAAREWIASLA